MLVNPLYPLVSIVVITYNSEKYVLETLESAKAQTYQNIELIISDDGSQDQTVKICENWLEKNNERFVASQIITVNINTGIPANCNRGVKASKGDWIKLIAGDDAFYPDAMDNFITEAKSLCRNDLIIQTYLDFYREKFEVDCFIGKSEFRKDFFNKCPQIQHEIFLLRYVCQSPALFFKKEIFARYNFDEQFKLLEDSPFLLKLTYNGLHVKLIDCCTVKYRIHSGSIQRRTGYKFYTNEQADVFLAMLYKYKDKNLRIRHLKFIKFLNNHNLNKVNFFTKIIEMYFFKTINSILVNKYKI